MDYKKTTASDSTITRDFSEFEKQTGNIYESLTIISKRAKQIQRELKEELDKKLQEFASYTDNLEEIFENREQIEISKFYERLPKPILIATREYLDEDIYFRRSDEELEEK
ncbi:MAG: DNA-directed RNA polymerase subunit omega [Bacteroidales bacterium]|nr:DNA-directed RNA polymerase subunit omega [Bacteroidales bacterium]